MGKNIKPFEGTPITKARRRGGHGEPLQTFHQQKQKRNHSEHNTRKKMKEGEKIKYNHYE
jgi:hypothetical protein